MTAINGRKLWLPLLVLLASGLISIVYPAAPTGEDIVEASFVFRKKPGTADVVKCTETIDCFLQQEFCAAFYMGENFFVTGAHCLVAKDGTIPNPESLDVLGVGTVNVTFRVHREYSSTTGVDIAWIYTEDPRFSSEKLIVAELNPEKCIRYNLEVFDTNPSDIRSGFRWVRQKKTPHPKASNMATDPIPAAVLPFEYRKVLDRNDVTEHVIMCSIKQNPDDFELHFIAYGTVDKTSFDIDCHRARCGVVKPENMQVLPPVRSHLSIPVVELATTTTTEAPADMIDEPSPLSVPSVDVPDVEVPDDEATDVEIPDDEVPVAEIPDDENPDVEIPDDENPDAEIPDAEIAIVEIPDDEIPDDGIPDDEIPDDEIPDAEIPDAESSEDEIPDTEIPDDEVPEIPSEDLFYANSPSITIDADNTEITIESEPTDLENIPLIEAETTLQEDTPEAQPAVLSPMEPEWVPEQNSLDFGGSDGSDNSNSGTEFWRQDSHGGSKLWQGGSFEQDGNVSKGKPNRVGGDGSHGGGSESKGDANWIGGGASQAHRGNGTRGAGIGVAESGSHGSGSELVSGPYWNGSHAAGIGSDGKTHWGAGDGFHGRPNWGGSSWTNDDGILVDGHKVNDISWDAKESDVGYFAATKVPSSISETKNQPTYNISRNESAWPNSNSWLKNDSSWDLQESDVGYYAPPEATSSTEGTNSTNEEISLKDVQPSKTNDYPTYTRNNKPKGMQEGPNPAYEAPSPEWSPLQEHRRIGIVEKPRQSKCWNRRKTTKKIGSQLGNRLTGTTPTHPISQRADALALSSALSKSDEADRELMAGQGNAGSLTWSEGFHSRPKDDSSGAPAQTNDAAECVVSEEVQSPKQQTPLALNDGVESTETEIGASSDWTSTESVKSMILGKRPEKEDAMPDQSTDNYDDVQSEAQWNTAAAMPSQVPSKQYQRKRRNRIQMLPALSQRSLAPPGAVLDGAILILLTIMGFAILMMLI